MSPSLPSLTVAPPRSVAERREAPDRNGQARRTDRGLDRGLEFAARVLGIAATLAVALVFPPRELGLAAALVGLAAVLAETASSAGLRARGAAEDRRPSGDLPAWLATLTLAGGLVALVVILRGELAVWLGAFEIERMLILAMPLALVGASARVLRRSRVARRVDPLVLLVGIAALGATLGLAAAGKGLTSLLVGAGVAVLGEGLRSLGGARLAPSRRTARETLRVLHAALASLPLCAATALMRRLDLFVVLACLGPDFAGAWCLARAVALEPGRAVLGLVPAWRPRTLSTALARSPELGLIPWLAGLALLGPQLAHDLVGPRWDAAALLVRSLAGVGMAMLLANSAMRQLRRGSWTAGPSILLALIASAAALAGSEHFATVLVGGVAALATARLLRFALRGREHAASLALVAAATACITAVTVLGLLGVRDLADAHGRPAGELLVLAFAVGVLLHGLTSLAWPLHGRRPRGWVRKTA